MSLSPTPESTSDEILQYDVGWAALNKLMRQGRSFSGRERHCFFLNLGTGDRQFANVSGATGLDQIDDGRGLALADWDYDGRIDFWMNNRTGPRVRFMHNQLATENAWVALRLEGGKTNRDGIGARVEVHLEGGGKPLVQTSYAGSGFLAQSSKWLHFGLGSEAKIKHVDVRWAGGERERFAGVSERGFFRLIEGKGSAERWQPPVFDASGFSETDDAFEQGTSSARVMLLQRPPMPDVLGITNKDGASEKLSSRYGKPLLLQIWATWCPNCKNEMEEWTEAESAIRDAGLEVLSVCVDEPTEDRADDLAKALATVAERGFPFETGLANTELVEHLNLLQKSFVGRQTDLPLPSAFLIDSAGRLAVVYKGPADLATILADAKLATADASSDEILAAAMPYPGRWMDKPGGTRPRAFAISLAEHGLVDAAKAYLNQIIPLYSDSVPGASEKEEERRITELGECHVFLGAIHFDESNYEDAIRYYEKAVELMPLKRGTREELIRAYLKLDNKTDAAEQLEVLLADRPKDAETLAQLASLRTELGEPDEAISLYRKSLDVQPRADVHSNLGNLLRRHGRAREAVEQYVAALELRPGWILPANNLAWIYATHPDDEVRNGKEAEKLARLAAEATKNSVPQILGTHAAALAELGEFGKASEKLAEAIKLAQSRGDEALVGRLEEKRALYAKGMPFRDAALREKGSP